MSEKHKATFKTILSKELRKSELMPILFRKDLQASSLWPLRPQYSHIEKRTASKET